MALVRPVDTDTLLQVGERMRPVALAREQVLAVLAPLAPLFPEGGLRRGSTVTVEGGPGVTSLALALGAAASARGSWVAAVGLVSVGWLRLCRGLDDRPPRPRVPPPDLTVAAELAGRR